MTNKDHIERTKRMIEVMQAYVDGELVEYCCNNYGYWSKKEKPHWNWESGDYRIAPSTTPDSINWDHVAPEFKYMARDERGLAFIHTEKPKMHFWYWHSNQMLPVSDSFASYRKGTVDWKDSLVIRPGCE